jgi:hypothetical protein
MTALEPPQLRPSAVSRRAVWRSCAVVIVGSVAIGALTSPAQQYLPDWLNSLANSAGGWSMFAFLLVWLSRARPLPAAVLGAVSFVLMVESYGAVSAWRGHFFAEPLSSMWVPIGLVAGPIIGLAASAVRHSSRPWAIAGVSVLSLVLFAEGIYGLTIVRETTSPVYWSIEIAAAVAFSVAALLRAGGGRSPV